MSNIVRLRAGATITPQSVANAVNIDQLEQDIVEELIHSLLEKVVDSEDAFTLTRTTHGDGCVEFTLDLIVMKAT